MAKSQSASALRNSILSLDDLKRKPVVVADWNNAEFILRGITAAERERVKAASLVNATDDDGDAVRRVDDSVMSALLVITATLDPESGEQVFEDADRDSLMKKSAGVVSDLATEISKLSGFHSDAVKEIAKNSDATTNDVSTSA